MDINNEHSIDYSILIRSLENNGGDKGVIEFINNKVFITLMDGSGHQEAAFLTVNMAEEFMRIHLSENLDLEDMMKGLNIYLKRTVGAAIFIGLLDLNTLVIDYVSMGNVTFVRYNNDSMNLGRSRDGIVGNLLLSPKKYSMNLKSSDTLLLYTDGIKLSRSSKELLMNKNALTLCSEIMENNRKDDDDAGCIVIKVK